MSKLLTQCISIYDKVDILKPKGDIPLDIFLENIRDGKWEDIVHRIRIIEDKAKRDEIKKQIAPYVTLSGTFTERSDSKIEKHSGYIGIDVDNVTDPEYIKSIVCPDKYVQAAFVSIGGRGLCLVFKINPDKHREAFQGISEYLYSSYGLVCDPTSINVSRARFVSWDPNIYIADEPAELFRQYPKEKAPKKIDKVIFDQGDFEQILKQVMDKQLDVTQSSYHIWLRLAFALVWKYGEQGREYFHLISQYSPKYDANKTDKQYTACLKHQGSNKETTISTFYYYAKQTGCDIYTQRTKTIAYTAATGKKEGLNEKQVAENLKRFEGIEDAEGIIKQVFENGIEIDEDTLIDQIELWVRQNYSLERNELTRYIENNGMPMQQKDMNTLYIRIKKLFDNANYELIDRLINSDFVPTYNPLHRWFKNNEEMLKDDLDGNIEKLLTSVETKDQKFLLHFGYKWFVGAISAIYGEHSPLMFVLSGAKQNTGKTQFFRRILPRELHTKYYAESKLDAGKDDEILMTQKWIIMDDEMGGKSKKEVKRLKELTSKQTFSLREPYGRNNVDLNRIAVLCGTTNDNEILSDPTGNRRLIPISVYSISHKQYNEVDKTKLWMEAYKLWKNGYKWELDSEDIEYLAGVNPDFEMIISESELVSKYFAPGDEQKMTATDIKVFIEAKTNQKLSVDRIGKELKRLGFSQGHYRIGKAVKRMYGVTVLNGTEEMVEIVDKADNPVPVAPVAISEVINEVEYDVELSEIIDVEHPDDDLPF